MKTLLQELCYFKLRHKSGQQHQLWQEGSHPQIIESDEMMWQKIEYVHNNPLRRGYVDACEDWRLFERAGLCWARVFGRCRDRLAMMRRDAIIGAQKRSH